MFKGIVNIESESGGLSDEEEFPHFYVHHPWMNSCFFFYIFSHMPSDDSHFKFGHSMWVPFCLATVHAHLAVLHQMLIL
jgi:hypothetical protein